MGIFDSLGKQTPSRAAQQIDPRQMQQAMQQEIGRLPQAEGLYCPGRHDRRRTDHPVPPAERADRRRTVSAGYAAG